MRMAYIFWDVHMANGHDGLIQLMKKKRAKLNKGDCAIFVNTKLTAVKMLVDGVFVAHYKHEEGTIDPATLRYLPRFLQGQDINYKKALSKVINERLDS